MSDDRQSLFPSDGGDIGGVNNSNDYSTDTGTTLPSHTEPTEYVPYGTVSDPLITAVQVACRTFVPSKRQMDWVDDLAREFGQEKTIRALMWAAEQDGQRDVLRKASDALKLQRLQADRKVEQQDEAERQERQREAARDREMRRREAIRVGQSEETIHNVKSFAELMGGMPDFMKRAKEQADG